MKIHQIIDDLDALDVRMLNDRRHFVTFAQFLFNVYDLMQAALLGKNAEESFDGDMHVNKSSLLMKPYATPERVTKLYTLAYFFTDPANQKLYIKAMIPQPELQEEQDSELQDFGIHIPEEFELHPGNVFRTQQGIVQLHSGAHIALQQKPALDAFADHLDTVLEYLVQQEGEHAIQFTELKADLISIREQARNQQLFNPPAEGLKTLNALQHLQKKCDHAMLSAIHRAKLEAPTIQSFVTRILDSVQRLIKEHIPKLMYRISGTSPKNPLYEYRFNAVRNNSDTEWMKKMEIVAVAHLRHKAP